MFTERPLTAGSSSGTLQARCSQLRLSLPAQHVHARRLSHGKWPSLGIAAAPRTPRAVASSHTVVIDEEVDAIAVLERPGAVPSTHFEQHDQAMQQLQELEAFSTELSSAILRADNVLEQASWGTLTLPPTVKSVFKEVYREERKKDQKQFKEERRKRAALREQERAARSQVQQADPQASLSALAQPPAPIPPSGTEQPSPAQPQQPLQQQPQPVAQSVAAAPSRPATAQTQRQRATQPLAQQALQQPQPVHRTRRSRSSANIAPAALSRSVLNSISALPSSIPAGCSSSSERRSASAAAAMPDTASALSALAPAAAAVSAAAPFAPAAGRSGRSRATRAAATSSVVASSSSSSTSELAVASPVQQPATSGFVPLPVLQLPALQSRSAGAPVPSTSRRVQRAAGVGRRSSVATAAAAVAANPLAPSLAAAKLADNTIHGLDMRAELLTGEQEKDLAVMVQDLLHLEQVARDLAVKLGRTPSDMEWMEAADAQGDFEDITTALTGFQQRVHAGRSAKQVMIKANYKLVVSICRKYQGLGMNMGDLINEGIAGLVKGVERFEPSKGFKFSTYAHWWIRQSVSRSLADQGRLVRLPIHMQELLSRAQKASRAFEAKHGREPTAEELASELGVEASRIKDAWEAVTSPRSLDQPMGDADGGTLGDVVEDDRTIGSEEAVYIESLKQDLEGVLKGLSARDAGVLRMRFGLQDGREYTLDEVGAEFKVTRERIRQIEAKAIRQLRAHHISPGSVMADYQFGPMSDKQLASRTSSGTKKQK